MAEPGVLEQALARAEVEAAAALRGTAALARDLKRARSGADVGQIRELRAAVSAAREHWDALGGQLSALEAAYDVDEVEYLSSGAYVAEVLAAAAAAGLAVGQDPDAPDRLLSYPSVVRVLPGDAAIEVDRKRDRRLRPSALVARLAHAQHRPPRSRSEPFLESLAVAYELVTAREGRQPGAVVRLDSVWSVLTLLPGTRADYGKPEFTRDLYQLDLSKVVTTKDGRRLRFAASSGTRGAGVLTTVARDGRQQLYWGVALVRPPGR